MALTKMIWGLGIVLVVALGTRVIGLGEYPVSLGIDEVANAYNAYSILTTGRDEWGVTLPLAMRSFNDYKAPLNIYMIVPSIKLLGKTEAAVRLPTAVFGALTALVWMVWVRRLGIGRWAVLASGLGLALLPWHIHYSRGTFEAVTALFLVILGLSMWQKKKTGWMAGAGVMLGLAMWTYHAQRVFVPLLLVWMVAMLRNILGFVIALMVVAAPLVILGMTTPAIRTRAMATSFLQENSLVKILHHGDYKSMAERIWDNDWYLIYRHGLGKYLNYFDVRYWYWNGLHLSLPGYPDMGLMYLAELPVWMLGVWALSQGKYRRLAPGGGMWGLAGVVPAAMTMNEQHSLRALVWWPFFGLITAVGYNQLKLKTQNSKFKRYLVLGWVGLWVINLAFFYHMYTNQTWKWLSEYWQYPYKQVSMYACDIKDKYRNVFLSEAFGDTDQLTSSPQLYLAWYCGGRTEDYVGTTAGKIMVKRPYWPADKKEYGNSLFIAAPWDFGKGKLGDKEIVNKWYFLNGKLAFVAVETE